MGPVAYPVPSGRQRGRACKAIGATLGATRRRILHVTDPRRADTTALNPPGPEGSDLLRELLGEEAHDDQDGALDVSEIEIGGPPSDTELYEGEPASTGGIEDLASLELREGETDNPDVAAEEGEVWVPPVDPPVVADADAVDGIRIAAGFGTTAGDDPFDADHHGTALPADDEVSARVREALLADARTSRLADRVEVETAGGVVRLRGDVDDIEDGDLLVEVATEVSGITDVRDETEVPGL
jgi:hypothetical protein